MSTREVELTGGAPWGFRMHGGVDQNQPLRISRSHSYNPERTLDVNPGRKASLSGIREGDVISSINGKSTRSMSNSDAHAMLRSAGPVLRLGLNEDREMSPRRRSIGKSTELKRPSQLIAEANRATLQAPVYATIRPSQSPQNRLTTSPLRSSLNSLPSALNSTPLVKAVIASEEPMRFHPTNPFYTTLPSNYTSASKLPVPNGRVSISGLDRSRSVTKSKDTSLNNSTTDLKSPSFFNNISESGPSSLQHGDYVSCQINGHSLGATSNTNNGDPFFYYKYNQIDNHISPKEKIKMNNPFEIDGINKDPFEKYLQPDRVNGKYEYDSKNLSNSLSDSNFRSNEEITKCSTITEHKISEVEEVKTIKKIILNGSGDDVDHQKDMDFKINSPTANTKSEEIFSNTKEGPFNKRNQTKSSHSIFGNENTTETARHRNYDFFSSPIEQTIETNFRNAYEPPREERRNHTHSAETPKSEAVPNKPPPTTTQLNSPAHTSPTTKQTVMITPTFKARSASPAIWRAGAPTPPPAPAPALAARSPAAPPPPPPPPPVWSPASAGPSPKGQRKTFRPVHFEETPPARRKFGSVEQNGCTSGSESEGRMRTSQSAPATGLNTLGSTSSRLPRAQNPTVTLLQKAREGQLSRGASYLQQDKDVRLARDRCSPPRSEIVHSLRREYASEGEADRSDYQRGGPRKMADASPKIDGVGPTTRDGMPLTLRSEVKDPSRWYKKMYDTIHKNKLDDDYVTIRYKNRRGQEPQRVTSNKSQYAYFDPRSGYLSEPEGGIGRLGSSTWSDTYDSDVTSAPRRRTASVQEERRNEEITSHYLPSNKYSTLASARARQEVYKNQPGRIENYVPGKSSVVDKEAKQWWDEVMDIFDGQISSTTSLPQPSPKERKDITSAILSKSNMARALKESGYESDSTLIFRRREEQEAPLSPAERRAAYRDLQAGGEPPLRGFRSPAPPRQESPRRYVESDVNIHYRCPVRHDPLPLVPERELAMQQAEHMKRLYREQKRNKYLQELQDMQNRRHQDNFTPSQKTIVPLNRYDEAEKTVARALYAFNGQTQRELSFRKGDLIHVRRQIDTNWYEGELHGRIGLFPYNYVEIVKGDVTQSLKKPSTSEGRARAKFDFTAQTNLELPLKKGEVVALTRRIDHNWWEGRKDSKTGIFPDSYVTILQEPSHNRTAVSESGEKPVASPAAHGVLNGGARRSMGPHSYTPQHNNPALANAPPATQPLPGYVTKASEGARARGYGPPAPACDLNNTEPLYVDTNAEAVPYRAMYKYRPQNPDELELNEGDTVYVLEKCDDGWYVGSSQRTGRFGTFPGNYVERI